MDLFSSIATLFTQTPAYVFLLAAFGLVMAVSGIIRAHDLIFIVSGGVTMAASLAAVFLHHGGLPGGGLPAVFILLLIMLLTVTTAFLLSVRYSKYSWIIREPVSVKTEKQDAPSGQ